MQWNESSKYNTKYRGGTACQAYTEVLTDIACGQDVNMYGSEMLYRREITPATIQPYDTIVIPGSKALHGIFVLYVSPNGDILTTEGNWNDITRTGWNLYGNVYELADKLIYLDRRATTAWWDNDIW